MLVNIQFSDSTNTVIISYFNSPQDPSVFPNQGQIDTSDARYVTWYDEQSFFAQMALPAPSAATTEAQS